MGDRCMVICRTLLFLLGCLFSAAFAGSSAANPATSLENTLASIHTLQAHFSETISTDMHQVTQQLTGEFMLKKPGKFLWKTENPIHQDIISDGKKLWIYDKDLAQIMVKSLKDNVGVTPVLLLNGKSGSIANQYHVTYQDQEQDRVYTLRPNHTTFYHYIQIFFDKQILMHMRFEDSLGQLTDIYFTDIHVNQSIRDQLFIFSPPSDVDIVDG